MRSILFFSKRYLFAKGDFNIVNVISLVSVFGIAIITMALVVVMSIFNGLDEAIKSMYNSFDSAIKIEAKKGKTFYFDDADIKKLYSLDGVGLHTKVIENMVVVFNQDESSPAIIKGVDNSFLKMSNLQSLYFNGEHSLGDDYVYKGLIGYGLSRTLKWHLNNHRFNILAPNRESSSRGVKALNKKRLLISGEFSVSPEYDSKYLIAPRFFVQELFGYNDNEITSVEVSIKKGFNESQVKSSMMSLFGDRYKITTRIEKNQLLFQSSNTEKKLTTAMVYFILLLAAFTLLASLSMLVIDKQNEILTLKSLGATNKVIASIFFYTGFITNTIGVFVGVVLGMVLVFIQDSFGLVKLSGMVTDHYPVKLLYSDVLYIVLFTSILGVIISKIPVKYLVKNHL